MQRVIQRTATARKQAQKKLFRAKQQEQVQERQEIKRVKAEYTKAMAENAKAARQTRWEDWAKGPLAPKRDIGTKATSYGAVDAALMNPPKIPKHLRRRHILFAAGDRVCIIRGRDKGKINEITQVNEETETVVIKDINKADIAVPEWAKASMNIQADVLSQSLPVPFDDIRHVIALRDPETRTTKDHIIEHVYAGKPFLERPPWSKLPRYSRWASGLDLLIPWPTEDVPSYTDGELDTLGWHVDEVTWEPSIKEPPFPPSVLDELRNKFSRFRTRHEPEFVREKIIEEYRQQYLESQSLLTPPGEKRQMLGAKSAAKKKKRLDAKGNVIMDKKTANFISQYMNQGAQPQ